MKDLKEKIENVIIEINEESEFLAILEEGEKIEKVREFLNKSKDQVKEFDKLFGKVKTNTKELISKIPANELLDKLDELLKSLTELKEKIKNFKK